MRVRAIHLMLTLCVCLCSTAFAENRVEKAKGLLEAKDCDQLLLGFENAKPSGNAADDSGLAKVLADATAGPCAADKVVAFSLGSAAARLAPKDASVLLAAGNAARGAGQNGEAATFLDKAIAAAPSDVRPRVSRAELAMAEGEPKAAVGVLEPVKSNPKAAALYQSAQKAVHESAADRKRLADAEKTPPAPADTGKGSKGRKGKPDNDDLPMSSGSGKPILTRSASLGPPATFRVPTKAGHTYRVRATGSCRPMRWVAGLDAHGSVPGSDVRIKIGSFEHGLATDNLNPHDDDFDFVADSNNATAVLSNNSTTTTCTVSMITFTEQ